VCKMTLELQTFVFGPIANNCFVLSNPEIEKEAILIEAPEESFQGMFLSSLFLNVGRSCKTALKE